MYARGGVLLYSTCTVLKRENEDIVNTFLGGASGISSGVLLMRRRARGSATCRWQTLLPQKHGTDGFFICKLRRDA